MSVVTAPAPRAAQEPDVYASPRGWRAAAAVSHKQIGRRFMVTALVFFALGGVEALVMRLQLIQPENELVAAGAYNELFTMHGSTMMFLFVVPFLEGLANYLIPLMTGARDLPFPRFNAFNYWLYLAGGVLLYASVFFGAVPDGGWFGYVPLTGPVFSPGSSIDFWLTGITLAEISAIGSAIEFIVSILRTRTAGMSLSRMPIFVWAMLVTAFMIVIAFTPLAVGSLLLESDRALGTAFFEPVLGGAPLMWQHFFWIFGHPEVYVMFLPAAGVISQIVQAMTHHRLVGYTYVVAAVLGVGFLSMGLWVHHMFTVGLPGLAIGLFSAASLTIAIPNGIQIFAWIATMLEGRPRFNVPMMYVIGFVVTFVIGGVTGVMVAVAPFDFQVHDSYFLVAHFHYVLIGGVVFPILAGVHYWFPKLRGRMLDHRLSVLAFWLIIGGFHLGFFPMHITGLVGMPRRVYTYPEESGWAALNLVSTVGAFVLATGFFLVLVNLLRSWRRGAVAPADPWSADTLEWQPGSLPSNRNFDLLPVVQGRHPRWEAEPEPLAPAPARVVGAVNPGPRTWRATLGSSAVNAEPVDVVQLPQPTFVPLVPAAGTVVAAIGVLSKSGWAAAIGALVTVIGALAWWVVNERERRGDFEREPLPAGVAVDGDDGHGVGRWGVNLALLVAAVSLASLVFAYYYLQVHNDSWPPLQSPVDAPSWMPPFWATVAALVAAVSAHVGIRGGGERAWHVQVASAVVSVVAGLVGLVVWVGTWGDLGFDHETDAYGSSFFALALFAAMAIGVAVAASATAAVLGHRISVEHRRRTLTLRTTSIWWFAAAAMAVVFFVDYLGPRLGL